MKKTFFMQFLSFALCLFSFSGYCDDSTLLQRVQDNYNGSKSISTSFDLMISWKVREKVEKKKGRLILSPGNRFRIELGTGLWVSDGVTLWQYDKPLSQVIIKKLVSCNPAQLPSHVISSYLTKYKFTQKNVAGKGFVLEWTADTLTKSDMKHVRVNLDTSKASVNELFVVDKNENESTYAFHGTSVGSPVAASTFTFEIPKGVRVLDEN